ncbi:MAG TPA: ATP-binding protein [Gemmatimonadales bacterium]|nr:ATP-binding protein [Gemmatimonadales bacterium]
MHRILARALMQSPRTTPPGRAGLIGRAANAPPGAPPPDRNAVTRLAVAFKEAVLRLFSPHTTSEQLMEVLHRVEGIRTAAEAAERRWLEAQLRQAQKLETIGQLAGGIAHDFNNILAVILANSELLASAIPPDRTDLLISVRKVQDAARGGASMVKGLLGFSRRADLNFKTLDLREVVADLSQMVRPILPDNVEMRIVPPPEPCPVWADSGALQQVLLNLVTNARDAMAQGGTLTIEVSAAPTRGAYPETASWGEAQSYYCVAVNDTGVGMDPATVERVFEPFFTTKAPGTGTGLGMAMVYGLTKQHGGFVHVYSEPGIGTAVKVYLPVSPEAAAVDAAATAKRDELVGGNETILLVEDKEELRSTTRRVLERLGYTVMEAADGEEALGLHRDHRDHIDLILSDVLMPKVGGPALYQAVRATDPATRFLFTSGYTESDIGQRSLLEPGVLFVAKPWTISDLARQVRRALDRPTTPA